MSRKSSAGWLIGTIFIISALGVAAFLIPFRPCGTCDGLSMALHMRTSPSWPPAPPPRIDCPDCRDRGKVSLYRSWNPSMAKNLRAILPGLNDSTRTSTAESISALLHNQGTMMNTLSTLKWPDCEWYARGRFVAQNGRHALVLSIRARTPGPAASTVGVLLIDLQGKLLDQVVLHNTAVQGNLWFHFLEKQDSDGALIVIVGDPVIREAKFGPEMNTRIDHGDHTTHHAMLRYHGRPCRIAVRSGRLEVLAPAER